MLRSRRGVIIGATLLAFLAGTSVGLAGHIPPRARDTRTFDLLNGSLVIMPVSRVVKAIDGVDREMFAYAGSIPGPTLRVRQGSRITLVLQNNTDEPTTLHAHGLRLKNASDGVPGVTQPAIKPGERFTYTLDFPDAGVFWYHPHVRSWFQQEKGLYGTFIVEPRDPTTFDAVDREEVLVLDDFLRNAPAKPTDVPFALMGRYGDLMLVNGRSDYVLRARRGEVVRLHLVNVANARPFRFAIPGVRMKLVGADAGRPEWQTWTDGVVIAPAERSSVDVLFDRAGDFAMQNAKPTGWTRLAKVEVSSTPGGTYDHRRLFNRLRYNWDVLHEFDLLRYLFSRPVDKRLKLSLELKGTGVPYGSAGGHGSMGMGTSGGSAHGSSSPATPKPPTIEWDDPMPSMGALTSQQVLWKVIDSDTGDVNSGIQWSFKLGDRPIIEIFNDPSAPHPMQHPIHFHGQRFLVLSEDGRPNANLAWKDTVLVKAGSRIRILLEVTNPGHWMAHCHIPEHAAAGMETIFGAGVKAPASTSGHAGHP